MIGWVFCGLCGLALVAALAAALYESRPQSGLVRPGQMFYWTDADTGKRRAEPVSLMRPERVLALIDDPIAKGSYSR